MIDAENIGAEDKKEKLYSLPVADTDIVIVENQNKDGFFEFTSDKEEPESP